MQCNIAFYIHHHGSGHLMRALALAKELLLQEVQVHFLGSGLSLYEKLIPSGITTHELPWDVPEVDENPLVTGIELKGLHYAPLLVRGQRERCNSITTFFKSHPNVLLIVDVSVEIAMLARLCGVPTIVVRQHGNRNDLAHELAYRNSQALLAPYGESLKQEDPDWLSQKTFYTGGFSKFSNRLLSDNLEYADRRLIGVLVGQGGSSINSDFLIHLSKTCVSWNFMAIGNIDFNEYEMPQNLKVCNYVDDPFDMLVECIIVIGNAGHNTVMEMASLNKRFIAIPESRPFEEQLVKAALLQKHGLAEVVDPNAMFKTQWDLMFKNMVSKQPDWKDTISTDGTSRAASFILNIYKQLNLPV